MKKKIPHTFGGNVLNFEFPKSWGELSDEQLHYVAFCKCNFPSAQLKTYVFIRFAGIRVHRRNRRGWLCSIKSGFRKKIRFILSAWQIESFIHQLDWMDEPPAEPVRLSVVSHYVACDARLRELPFGSYLICENLYQGYLHTKDSSCLLKMKDYLYTNVRLSIFRNVLPHRWSEHELLCVMLWWLSVKNYFLHVFPHFFQPINSSAEDSVPDMLAQMNVQIRALTGGDVTKEDFVMKMDTWRALTELDAKAREIQEIKKKQKQ